MTNKLTRDNEINKLVFEFKQKYFITELVKRDFNLLKTARELNAHRGTIRKHIGYTKREHKELAKKYREINHE